MVVKLWAKNFEAYLFWDQNPYDQCNIIAWFILREYSFYFDHKLSFFGFNSLNYDINLYN